MEGGAQFGLCCRGSEAEVKQAENPLAELSDLCRFPDNVNHIVIVGTFSECVSHAPQSDVDIMGLPRDSDLALDLDFVDEMFDEFD